MTVHKHLKQLIRARMEKTGERYAAARRQVIGSPKAVAAPTGPDFHFPGNIAATTALRIVLTQAGVRDAHSGEPFSEAMLFGIAGGIGIGLFSFYYAKPDFATFFIAGRHQWHDDLAYLKQAVAAFGLKAAVRETSGNKTARQQLVEAVAEHRPCIAWVDMASLPHRGMPEAFRGMTYHVVTVYEVDEKKGTALIGDLTDSPITVSLKDLDASRARIKKQKFRLLSIEPERAPKLDLRGLVQHGLRRCHDVFLKPTLPQSQSNGRLEVLQTWANRLTSTKDPERWERNFRPGANFWRGLNSVYSNVETYGTGGGLCRPIFADFLNEAAESLKRPALRSLGERYQELGRGWSELAEAALPDNVPAFRKAKELRCRLAELRHDGGPAEEAREVWRKLDEMEKEAASSFPLSESQCADLRADLSMRVQALYDGETAALKTLRETCSALR